MDYFLHAEEVYFTQKNAVVVSKISKPQHNDIEFIHTHTHYCKNPLINTETFIRKV